MRKQLFRYAVLFFLLLPLSACSGEAAPAPAPAEQAAVEAPATDTPAAAAQPDAAAPTETPAPAAQEAASQPAAGAGKAAALPPEQRDGMYPEAPPMALDPAKFYYATIKTAKGDIKVQLFADRTPLTVNSFVFLAREGFFDNTTFHRVLEGFMMQGGDPTGTGMGGPGYEFVNEPVAGLDFTKPGILAMANAGPDTNGSQFFITFEATPQLNGGYTIFGEVIEGIEVLAQITRRDPQMSPTFEGDALQTILIEETDSSVLPPPPPTPVPTPTSTPFAATSLDASLRPLANISPTEKSNYFNSAPAQVISGTQLVTATILTSRGAVTVALNAADAPIAVNNFVALADVGFYDNTPINAVVAPGQDMLPSIIFGAPANRPDSDAGYSIVPEVNLTVTAEIGLLAYRPLRQGATGIEASSSQVLITLGALPPEIGTQFGFFGQVVAGQEILAQITMTDTIQSVTVTR